MSYIYAKKHREDSEFGSDSFLDVLANLVGILIILIVAVGVRVANSPVEELVSAEEYARITASLPQQLDSDPSLEPPVTVAPAIVTELVVEADVDKPLAFTPQPLPAIPTFPDIQPDERLQAQLNSMKQEYEAFQNRLKAVQMRDEQFRQARHDQEQAIRDLELKIAAQGKTGTDEHTRLQILETDVATLKNQVQLLRGQAEAIDLDGPPVEKLMHHLPPIGKTVAGDEVHFRLQGNRISHLPLNDMVREVQMDLERRKELLLTRNFFQGSTRAIDGYVMEYVMQRQGGSLRDDLNRAPGMVRIGVSSWVIRPTGTERTETLEEALRPGSLFRMWVEKYGPTTTVTLWVYPDSFELHSKIKTFTQQLGFWVASRPLPTGVPISGSPDGSKSVAQ